MCSADISKNSFTNDEVDLILVEFTSARIQQYLYSSADPEDNNTLMIYLVKHHGYNYNKFIEKLKNDKPELYKRLFVKTGV
jgi:hypothetical protein